MPLDLLEAQVLQLYKNIWQLYMLQHNYTSVNGAPEAYGSHRVCLWVSESFCEIAVRISPQALKIKAWNMQCKLNAVLSWNEIGGFWISSFIVELWHDLLTSMAVAAIQSPTKNKFPTTGCLSTWQFNLYNKSVGDQSENQRMRLPKLNSLSCAYRDSVRNWRHGLIWHPPLQIT